MGENAAENAETQNDEKPAQNAETNTQSAPAPSTPTQPAIDMGEFKRAIDSLQSLPEQIVNAWREANVPPKAPEKPAEKPAEKAEEKPAEKEPAKVPGSRDTKSREHWWYRQW